MSDQVIASAAGFVLGFSAAAAFYLKQIKSKLTAISKDIEHIKQQKG